MRKTYARSVQPFKAVLGFDLAELQRNAMPGLNRTSVDIGWLRLDFGRDGDWNEFVVARTMYDSFYLGVEPLPVTADDRWASGIPWVYAMKHHPAELFVGKKPPTVLKYAGITVVHAMDQRRRNFVTVEMQGGGLHLVFRNPGSRASADWLPSKLPIVIDAPVLQAPVVAQAPVQVLAPAKLSKVGVDTGDAELDALLNALAR